MNKLKEVTVYVSGDSSKISTWSNVPFFFTETLLARGIKVNRVDISPSPLLEKLIYQNFYRIAKLLHKGLEYDYFHSYTNFLDIRNRIKKAVGLYKNADADIFLTFSFSSIGLTTKPIIQFCDWTYDHHVKYLLGRQPDFFENQSIKREDKQIKGAHLVFSLFPSIAEYMRNRYSRPVHYLGNVINSVYSASVADIATKLTSSSLLFVGSKKYLEGAKVLLATFEKLKITYPSLVVHIIGMQAADFNTLPKDVFCHGYLDKGNDAQRALYYRLFKEARMFINTTPKWSSFSASVEAMYFYTPVIVTPYKEFLQTFGERLDFGSYCEENSAALLEEKVLAMLHHPAYQTLCVNAHEAVKEFTWDAYMDKITQHIESVMP